MTFASTASATRFGWGGGGWDWGDWEKIEIDRDWDRDWSWGGGTDWDWGDLVDKIKKHPKFEKPDEPRCWTCPKPEPNGAVPEPTGALLFAGGIAAVAVKRRLRR